MTDVDIYQVNFALGTVKNVEISGVIDITEVDISEFLQIIYISKKCRDRGGKSTYPRLSTYPMSRYRSLPVLEPYAHRLKTVYIVQ